MIEVYTGTPGSGKSLHMAKKILLWLRLGCNVIGTVKINPDSIKKYKGKYFYVDINVLNVNDLMEYSRKYCKKGKEAQVLLVIDECQVLFDNRDWQKPDRKQWNKFFQTHRHFGFNVLLITQFTKMIDKQICGLIEFNTIHRKVSNFGMFGFIISLFARGKIFVAVNEWFPIHMKVGSEFFLYRKKLGRLYDSYFAFDDIHDSINELSDFLQASASDPTPSGVGDGAVAEGVA